MMNQISWSPDGALFGGGGFTARNGDGLRTYVVRADGTYRLSVSPYLGASWYVEVDAYRSWIHTPAMIGGS